MLENIPIELKQLKQWVVADMTLNEKGDPKKTPLNPITGAFAAVDDPSTWGTFEQAVATGKPVGFVLTKSDPYCIIDLDDKLTNPASDIEKERFSLIVNQFNTYTEISTSGRGAHLILKGSIPRGINRSHVEMYSEGRYMICTGRVIKAMLIEERQDLLDLMYYEMQPTKLVITELEQIESPHTDAQIQERAMGASNGLKFSKLWQGNWKDDYPSQSEADFALMSMLCFYTKDNVQAIRLFRASALGVREKAQRDEYFIGKYGIVNKIRANELPELDFTQLRETTTKMLAAGIADLPNAIQPELQIPEGLVGELTYYFMQTATRPVKEIALAAALALVAGVTGRAYNTPTNAGLNLYLILLAKTGSGKEAAQSGIDKLIRAVRNAGVPMVEDFVGPATFASGQALLRVLDTKPCFFSILGEFGLTLQELSDPRSNGSTRMIKKVMLDLYTKSGAGETLRASVYSDTEKNTAIVQSPSFTILGESTPETFFEGLSESQISEGLIPRFSIIQYTGGRTARNKNAGCPPPAALVSKFVTLIASVLTAQNANLTHVVAIEPAAELLMDKFDYHADKVINDNRSAHVDLQLWNRAHLKALKLASVLAVANNPNQPIITEYCATWAIRFVHNDITLISTQFKNNDVGRGDLKQLSDMRKILYQFFTLDDETLNKIGPNFAKLKAINLIPYRFILQFCKHASFRNDKIGQNFAVKRTIQTLIDNGQIKIIPNHQFKAAITYEGICYSFTSDF